MTNELFHTQTINVLGQPYVLRLNTPDKDPKLVKWNGYHEPYSKRITVDSTIVEENKKDDTSAENIEAYVRHIYRHEILHAFFCESGITYKFESEDEDFLVDWIARMYPKMKKIFAELGVEE